MNLIFLGPPGAGKGTIAKMIFDEFQLIHISTGDLFRAAVKNNTPLGLQVKDILNAGGLIPDTLTIELVKARLSEPDALHGYILDGFPRTIVQADALGKFAKLSAVINFKIDNEAVIIQRLTGRRTCKGCGAIFHITNTPPAKEGICDKCQQALYTRDDDKLEAVTNRLEVYKAQTAPLIAYYAKLGLMVDIDAAMPAAETQKSLIAVLKGMQKV